MSKEKIIKAGDIARQVREYIKPLIKKDMLLLDIAEKIEDKIVELGGLPSFPTNLSINEVAAHYTPTPNDESKAHGLLKVDYGAHVDGWISDTAFSVDLEDSEVNKNLIEAAKTSLSRAVEIAKAETPINEVGKVVEKTMDEFGVSPIYNLSGHMMEQYNLHAGTNVPNYDDGDIEEFGTGLYAIEPFSTTGVGKIHEGAPGNIYALSNIKSVRNPTAREILKYIKDNFGSLPFCSRWIDKKFGSRTNLGLKQLEQAGILYQFPQLIEDTKSPVAQFEHTILIEENSSTATTK